MAKKKTEEDVVVESPPDVKRTDGDGPKDFSCWLWSEGDVLTEVKHDNPKDYMISVDGAPYWHVSTAPNGDWIYRGK